MMMRVDQPRQDDVALEIEDFIGGDGQLVHRADLFDQSAPNKKTTLGNFLLMIIHCDNICVFYKEGCHLLLAFSGQQLV